MIKPRIEKKNRYEKMFESMDVSELLTHVGNVRGFENLKEYLGVELGSALYALRNKADLMNKELDIVHGLLTELYNYDNVLLLVKKTLKKIKKECATK